MAKPRRSAKQEAPNTLLAPPPQSVRLEDLQKIDNHSLAPIWVDTVSVTMRTDGVATMRCFAVIPDVKPGVNMAPQVAAEVARLQVPVQLLKGLVDLVARGLSYYPSKPADLEAKP